MKILILGDGGHGKDTAAAMLEASTGWSFMSSSCFCAKHVVFPVLAELYDYQSVQECYDDRRNHREQWHLLIAGYNNADPSRLAREILVSSDIYVGMRAAREVEACFRAKLFDLIYWVDAYPRVGRESTKSMSINLDWVVTHPDRNAPVRVLNNSGPEMEEGDVYDVRSNPSK